jgi:hypothetical protein
MIGQVIAVAPKQPDGRIRWAGNFLKNDKRCELCEEQIDIGNVCGRCAGKISA